MSKIPVPSAPVPTRRSAIAAIAVAIAAVPLARARVQRPEMEQKPSTAANQSRTSIHYEIDFHPSPQRLYEAILDQKQFTAFSGLPATIDPTPGGAFSMFGGLIVGRNVELIPDQVPNPRIVQAWRPTHWEPGIYSIVHFEFKPRAAESTLIFDHTGFPAGEYDHLDWGWYHHYWDPIKKFLV
ncbi:MAG: SRPBCC family protein [Terracidiphilus sp.]|jgi:activator of HSP90 ATPase